MAETNIAWADRVWNPTRGCSRTGTPGCDNCYAERQAIRFKDGTYKGLVRSTRLGPRWTGEVAVVPDKFDEPLRIPQRGKARARIFVDSMSDFFHEKLSAQDLEPIWKTMKEADWHDFLILTKRPENIVDRLPSDWGTGYRNVWLGVSVENQECAEKRIPVLLNVPAAVHWLSCEPLLGPLDLRKWLPPPAWRTHWVGGASSWATPEGKAIAGEPMRWCSWIVAGGESGPRARMCNIDWLADIVEQCKAIGLPCFIKQLGAAPFAPVKQLQVGAFKNTNFGVEVKLKDRKGENPDEWPQELRVREFPK